MVLQHLFEHSAIHYSPNRFIQRDDHHVRTIHTADTMNNSDSAQTVSKLCPLKLCPNWFQTVPKMISYFLERTSAQGGPDYLVCLAKTSVKSKCVCTESKSSSHLASAFQLLFSDPVKTEMRHDDHNQLFRYHCKVLLVPQLVY
jgi:hypothetical protein